MLNSSIKNPVEKYLITVPTKSTKRCYKSHLHKFFNIIGVNPETYFENGRNYEDDLITAWQSMQDLAPGSRKMRMCVIKDFLESNDVVIKPKLLKNLKGRSRGVQTLTRDIVPTKQQLRKILSHGCVKERALFLISISSGMRIDEILQLKPNDIDFNSNPVKINIRAETTKNKMPRVAFISNEARDTLEEWLKERDRYLSTAIKRSKYKNYHKDPNDARIFPFKYLVARNTWNRMIVASGFDERDELTGRYKIHIHCLRKFFRTYMPTGNNPISVDVVETLMGHEGYLTQSYRRYPEQQLATEYLRAMPTVSIFESQTDTSLLEDRLEEKDKQIEDLRYQLRQTRDNVEQQIHSEIQKIEHRVLQKLIENLDGDVTSNKTLQELLYAQSEQQ